VAARTGPHIPIKYIIKKNLSAFRSQPHTALERFEMKVPFWFIQLALSICHVQQFHAVPVLHVDKIYKCTFQLLSYSSIPSKRPPARIPTLTGEGEGRYHCTYDGIMEALKGVRYSNNYH
jgi:hypothetical protein